jgi:hypothetical protein
LRAAYETEKSSAMQPNEDFSIKEWL